MPSLVVPSGGQLRVGFQSSNSAVWNVFGLWLGPGAVVDQGVANELASCVTSAWNTALAAAHVDSQTTLQYIDVRDLRQANLPAYAGTFVPIPGTGVGERTSQSIALCITLRTAKAGKSFRGRVYLPFDCGSSFDAETALYTTTAEQAGENYVQMLRQAISNSSTLAGNFQLAVLSRERLVSTPVTSSTCRSPLATSQRRRLPKRG